IKVRTGVDMLHAPYKDATRALTDLAAGEVDFMFYHPAAVMALIQGGRIRPIAVSSSTRSSAAPDVIPVDRSAERGDRQFTTQRQRRQTSCNTEI
ncbi:MAG: hypothetical protein EBR07_13105, partial [Planctomycetes bacterium]|nr:hypothetical protein [Planctomycetota bacterium]